MDKNGGERPSFLSLLNGNDDYLSDVVMGTKQSESTRAIALSCYWEQQRDKIQKARNLNELVVRKHRMIKLTATLTYKVEEGKLVYRRYDRKVIYKARVVEVV